jgi:hypothetical protein
MSTPATPQIIGTGITNAVWGISSVAYTGFCVSISLKRDGEESKIFDGNGFTLGLILYDDKDECTVDMILQTTDTVPTRGTVVTVASQVGFIVKSIERMWNQRDQAKWRFTADHYLNVVTS